MLAVLLFIQFALPCEAKNTCVQLLKDSFVKEEIVNRMRFINERGLYEEGNCHLNIHNLIKHLDEADLPVEDAEVLYFVPVQGDSLKPYETRGHVEGWRFHVVLLFDGLIYDFDYTQEIHPQPVRKYLRGMFGLNTKMKKAKVVHIPAVEYLDFLGQKKNNWYDYIKRPYRNLYDYFEEGNQTPIRKRSLWDKFMDL